MKNSNPGGRIKSDISLFTQKWLLMLEQSQVYGIGIINLLPYEILYDQIKATARRQRIACPSQQVLCLIETQLQCQGKCHRCDLLRLILSIAPDL